MEVQDIDSTNYKKHTLTAKAVEYSARHGKFFKIDKAELADRSKADILAKSLVCFEVTWMLVQCIARKVAGSR